MADMISALTPRRRSSGGSALDGYFDAQNSAMDSVDRFSAKRASNRAGQAMKSRDYSGAANEFYDAGMLGEGSEVQNYGQAQEDRASKLDAETVKKRGAFLVDLSRGLKNVPEAERNAQFERFAPALKSLGADDDLIGQLRQAPKDDASLDMFAGGVEKELEQFTLSPGSKRFDEKGKLIADAPFAPQYKEVGEGETLVEVGGGSGAAPAPTSGGADPSAVIAELTGAGARVTSARRSPERNAAVGGAPNSYHLTGRARDIVPPPGMSMAQLEQRLRSSGAEFAELINEGDHIHVAWAGQGAGPGARVIAQGPPKAAKEMARPATPEEKATYGISPDVPAQIRPDGSISVVSGTGATLKRVPAKIQEGYVGNSASVRQIDEAIAAIQANRSALGFKNVLGETLNQRLDPKGIDARAGVANIGSLIIHDRSGAAVTAAETPRLLPFIPTVTDTPDSAVKKLKLLRKQYENANAEIEVAYGEDSGYSAMGGMKPKPAAAKPSAAAKPTPGGLPPQAASQLKAGHITTFGNGQKWTIRDGKPARVS